MTSAHCDCSALECRPRRGVPHTAAQATDRLLFTEVLQGTFAATAVSRARSVAVQAHITRLCYTIVALSAGLFGDKHDRDGAERLERASAAPQFLGAFGSDLARQALFTPWRSTRAYVGPATVQHMARRGCRIDVLPGSMRAPHAGTRLIDLLKWQRTATKLVD